MDGDGFFWENKKKDRKDGVSKVKTLQKRFDLMTLETFSQFFTLFICPWWISCGWEFVDGAFIQLGPVDDENWLAIQYFSNPKLKHDTLALFFPLRV